MRIAQVLTYVSADGAFGGPLAVMSEQTTELARRGHDVEVFAGWDGTARFSPEGVIAHLFRVRTAVPRAGFSGLVAPQLVGTVRRRRADFDVVHVHLARDLITLPAAAAALRPGGPLVFAQTHGMIKPDPRIRARVFDIRTRAVLSGATGAFSLTDEDAARVRAVEPRTRLLELPNGVTLPPRGSRASRLRPEVLFLARLQPRKRVALFVEAAARLLAQGLDAEFVVVGPDEGDLGAMQRQIETAGIGHHVRYEGAVAPGTGRNRLAAADVYVLPSLNEPFPMSVLEALSVGTPTVISTTCHIAPRLGDAVATFSDSTGDEAGDLAATIGHLVTDSAARAALGERGRAVIEADFSIERVVDRLEGYYSGESTNGDWRLSPGAEGSAG